MQDGAKDSFLSVLLYLYRIMIQIQTKEVTNMKAATVYRRMPAARQGLPYPNAATRRQILNKLVDLLLVGAIGIAFAAIVLFLPVLA
jgi:hypothetical protein